MKKFMQTLLASGGIAAVLLAGCATQPADDEVIDESADVSGDEASE